MSWLVTTTEIELGHWEDHLHNFDFALLHGLKVKSSDQFHDDGLKIQERDGLADAGPGAISECCKCNRICCCSGQPVPAVRVEHLSVLTPDIWIVGDHGRNWHKNGALFDGLTGNDTVLDGLSIDAIDWQVSVS